MDRMSVHGIAVGFERRGSGAPVVLVHGFGGPRMWERVAPLLAPAHDVLLPHLPGFGESPPAAGPLTVRGHARLIARMLGMLEIRGAVVAGLSYGGEIAATIASEAGASDPGPVGALVLVCPTGTRRLPWFVRGRFLRPLTRPLLRAALSSPRITEALSRRSFHDPSARPADLVPGYLENLRRPGRLEVLVSCVEELREGGGGLPALVAGAGVPLTLVRGEHDRTIPASALAVLRGARPDAGTHVLVRCGHSAALERPEELAGIIAAAAALPPPDA